MSAVIPTFDPASADAEALEAFEMMRALRAEGYTEAADLPEPLEDERWKRIEAAEAIVLRPAQTLPGVIAQLVTAIPVVDQDRWIDETAMRFGLGALHSLAANMQGHVGILTNAAHALVEIEWKQALAAYEQSEADFDLALELKGLVEPEDWRREAAGEEPTAFAAALVALADRLEGHFSNEATVTRLVRTLVPDHAAYLRKVDIIIAEGVQEDCAPWLARDTAFLVSPADARAAGMADAAANA